MTSKEIREIDACSGSGALYNGNEPVTDVEYDIRVIQEFIENTPGLKNVGGTISCDSTTLLCLVMSRDTYTLHFEGTKRLDLFIKNSDGTIAATGPIYEEES